MTGRKPSNIKLVEAFFSQTGEHEWTCKCGVVRKQKKGTGFSNLISHIQSQHEQAYADICSTSQGASSTSFTSIATWSKRTEKIHAWIEMVVEGLEPFSFVKRPSIRRNVKVASISTKTLVKYMDKLVKRVELVITDLLPEKFAIAFDGWSAASSHFVCVFATFPFSGKSGYRKCLLGFSPFEDETELAADAHIAFIDFVLSVYGKTWDNVVCFTADNCSVNKSISNKTQKAMVGCHSHRFNIALQQILNEHSTMIEQINRIMLKLKNVIPAAKLEKFTKYKAKPRNTTRWSSTFEMLKRFQLIRPHLRKLQIDDIDKDIPTRRENEEIDDLVKRLEKLDSVTKSLQHEERTISQARALFDTVMIDFPEAADRLSTTASIIQSPNFEIGIQKIQSGRANELNPEEKSELKQLESSVEQKKKTSSATMSYAERVLKSQKTGTSEELKGYIDTRFILPCSNICEQFLSKAGYTYNDYRKGLLASRLEGQLFLHVNRSLWGMVDVQYILQHDDSKECDDDLEE